MANIVMLIGGALANALAFTGSSYLLHRLSADNIGAERKRHDAAIEALQKAQIEWIHKRQQRINFINNQPRVMNSITESLGFIALSMIGIGIFSSIKNPIYNSSNDTR